MSSQLYLLHRSILSPRPDGHKGRGPLLLSARPPLWRPLLRSLGQWSLSRPLRRRRRHYFVDNAPRGLVAKKAFSGNLSVCPRQQSSPLLSSARSLPLRPSLLLLRSLLRPFPLSSSVFRSRGGVSVGRSTNGAISESIVSGARYIWMRAREREEREEGRGEWMATAMVGAAQRIWR